MLLLYWVQKAFVAERTDLLEANMNRWKAGVQARLDKELDYLTTREKRVEDYEEQLRHLRVQDAEEYNMVKIKLETDVQVRRGQTTSYCDSSHNIPVI